MSIEHHQSSVSGPARGRVRLALFAAVALAVPALAAPAGAQSWSGDWCAETDLRRDQHCEVRTMELAARDGRFSVDAGPNGGIRVEGWNGTGIRVEARVVTRSDSEAAARELAGEVEVRGAPGSVSTDGPRFRRGNRSWSVSFRVLVPEGTDLDLRTSNGGISLSGVLGPVEAQTTNGALRLDGTSGRVRARTTNGGITVSVARQLGSGDSLDLRTTNGGIRLALPEGISARVEASTTNGGITTDFPITVQGRMGRRLSGTLGDGGPEIRASTTNGGIRLIRN